MSKSKEEDDTREETGCAKALKRKSVETEKSTRGFEGEVSSSHTH